MISKAALMEALGKRFDYQSTRNVYRDALSRSGLADQDGFSPADIERFVTALKKTERRLEAVLGALGLGPAVAAPSAAAPAKKPAPVVEAAPVVEEAPPVAEEPVAAEEAPADAAPAEGGDAAPEGDVAAEAAASEEPEDDKRGKKHKKK